MTHQPPRPNFEKLTFYLLILFLPTQLGKHFWPPFSQVLGIRIDYLSPTLYLTDILIFLLFLIWLQRHKFPPISLPAAQALFESRTNSTQKARSKPRRVLSHLSFPLIFVIYLCLNTLLSNNPLLTLYGLLKTLELLFLGIYIAHHLKIKKELTTIAIIFSLSTIGESLLAIAQYIHQGSLNGPFYFLGERSFTGSTPGIANASINGELILRPYATFSHPNILAAFLLCSLVIIFFFLTHNHNRLKEIIKAASLTLGSIALLLSLSRIVIAIWIFLVFSLILSKFWRQIKNRHDPKKIILFLSVIILFAALFSQSPALPRLVNTSIFENSFIQRTDLIKNSITIIQAHPFFGVGLYNFIPALGQIPQIASPVFYFQPVHNIFLLITAETGAIGLILSLVFLFKTFQHLLNRYSQTARAILLLLAIIIILGLFDHYWLTLQQGQLLLTLLLGLSWAL